MTYEEKKKLLLSYKRIILQEKALNAELDLLREGVKAIQLTGMPHSGDQRDLSDVMVKSENLLNRLQAVVDRKHETLRIIMTAIEQMSKEDEKTILTLTYIEGMKLAEVADAMTYTYRHLRRLHKRAVNNFSPEGYDEVQRDNTGL